MIESNCHQFFLPAGLIIEYLDTYPPSREVDIQQVTNHQNKQGKCAKSSPLQTKIRRWFYTASKAVKVEF